MDQHEQQGPTSGVTPHLTIHDGRCREAITFYESAFAAEQAMPPMAAGDMPGCEGMPDMKGDQRIMHAHLRINGGSLMMNDAFPEFVDPAKRSSADNGDAASAGRRCRPLVRAGSAGGRDGDDAARRSILG
jgi:PhnB protein